MHPQHYGNRLMVITFNLYVFTRQLHNHFTMISRLPKKKKNKKKMKRIIVSIKKAKLF